MMDLRHATLRMTTLMVAIVTLGTLKAAAQQLNITPLPKEVEMRSEPATFKLPAKYSIATQGTLDDRTMEDIGRFVEQMRLATGCKGKLKNSGKSDILLMADPSMGEEGYRLQVEPQRVTLRFATAAGCYYGLQSLRKMMPGHVILGKPGPKGADYSIPCLTITDAPRFGYRGFMLDVSRHFFPVEDIKHVLDIMAVYKMNRFHWHLSDDQGWRIEIKKYPLLTEVGSKSEDMLMNDETRTKYWYGKPYGPFFYTQEDVRDIVQYAAERHIEIIPEVDMPGHMMAALAAYPEISCHPDRTYKVWKENPGLSVDILDVSNPVAVQFARDVVDELCQLFPGPDIHIGGDECPIMQWENSEACKTMKEQLQLPTFRALQSWFIGEMAKVAASHGKGLFAWNESITSEGADLAPLQQNGVKIMCWVGAQAAARKATSHGLTSIITPIGPYYINRKQWNSEDEPFAAGPGNDSLSVTYRYEPVPNDITPQMAARYTGVQATFWTEFVATRSYLEYLMLPRLMAVAEAGWTPKEKKDFPDFVRRFNADKELLDAGGYNYGKHYLYK